ncbi:hypothetical protein [Emticicia fontis]
MQYVAIIAAVITLFKDTFSGLFKSREIKFIGIGLLAYYLYTTTKKKEEKEDIINTLPDNEAAILAEQLHDAFHPFISEPIFGWYPPDGTDEDKVKSIALQMSTKKNYQAVAQAYQTLFSSSLETDLRSEGVFDLFMNAYRSSGASNPTTPTSPTSTAISVMVGSNAYVKQAGVNIRNTSTGKALRTSTKGENLGVVMQLENKTVEGITGIWATCAKPAPTFGLFQNYVLVSAQYLTSIQP